MGNDTARLEETMASGTNSLTTTLTVFILCFIIVVSETVAIRTQDTRSTIGSVIRQLNRSCMMWTLTLLQTRFTQSGAEILSGYKYPTRTSTITAKTKDRQLSGTTSITQFITLGTFS